MAARFCIALDPMQDVHIGGHYLSTVAGGQIHQNPLDDPFFVERVKSDTAQHDAILLRGNGFLDALLGLHTEQPTGDADANKKTNGCTVCRLRDSA